MKISFQGRPGAYSQQAILAYDAAAQAVPYDSFEEILDAVKTGQVERAMLPVENTLGGTVLPACQALFASELAPVVECILPIHHVLMAPQSVSDIQVALSHPQALAQCQHYLKRHGIRAETFFDTAGAAEALAQQPRPHTAAIASAVAAKQYGLKVVDQNIEDEAFNQTRFLVVAKQAEPFQESAQYKTSLMFKLPNQPNALAKVLSVLGEQGVNLTKVESHPTRKASWEYLFFVDLMGHLQPLEAVLQTVRKLTQHLVILPSYRVGAL